MTDLSILNPVVLRSLVQEFTAPESLTWLNRVRKTPVNGTVAEWEIIRGARNIAQPNVPGSEANVVDRLGRTHATATYAYLREKKQFNEVTLRWLTAYATNPSEINKTSAERQIRRELEDLSTRFDTYAEYLMWQSFKGELTIRSDFNGVNSTVDYGVQASHKPSTTVSWEDATPAQIVSDVRALIDLVQNDGRVPAREAFTSGSVLDMIVDSFAHTGSTPSNFPGGQLMSDRMKDQYYVSGAIDGFLGLNWKREDTPYDPTGSSYTTNPSIPSQEARFLDKNALIIGNFDNDTIELQEGLSADPDAPAGHIGKFTKTWTQPDPGGRTFLQEWSMLPIINRPDNFVYVADVTSP